MFNKIFLPTILLILVYGFWVSPEFKEISAGVAVFLFGMKFLEQGFKAFTGGTLETILQKSTNRTWKSLLFGFSSATIMQSSSLVSLLAISFLSAELITLVQGIGIIFGANIGTTTGAWLIAAFGMKINISLYAMPMLVFGIIFSFQKSKVLKGIGSILAGLGFLFLGIHYMKEGFEAFQNSIQLIDYAIEGFLGILAFVGIGILATIVMQSSHATIILVIAALATGQVTYENALALVIGANIGTTITAILGSLTSNINGKRLAISDVLFKVSTGIIFILFMPFISDFINYLSLIIGIGADNYTLKLALFHTLFNVLGLLIVIPFMAILVKLVMRIFPDQIIIDKNQPLYLNGSTLDFPDTAIITITKETKHLYNKSINLFLTTFGLNIDDIDHIKDKNSLLKKVKLLDTNNIGELYKQDIKGLYAKILDFIFNAQFINDKEGNNHIYKIKEINIKIIENIKILERLQTHFIKYTKSTNAIVKEEYQTIIYNIIYTIKEISSLQSIDNITDKLILLSKIEIGVEESKLNLNKKIDKLIRNNLITSYMGSSLINDIHYKNQIMKNLLEIIGVVFNNNISVEITELNTKTLKKFDSGFDNILGLTNKKIEKIRKKLMNKELLLINKLNLEKEANVIKQLKNEIEIIKYTLNKY